MVGAQGTGRGGQRKGKTMTTQQSQSKSTEYDLVKMFEQAVKHEIEMVGGDPPTGTYCYVVRASLATGPGVTSISGPHSVEDIWVEWVKGYYNPNDHYTSDFGSIYVKGHDHSVASSDNLAGFFFTDEWQPWDGSGTPTPKAWS